MSSFLFIITVIAIIIVAMTTTTTCGVMASVEEESITTTTYADAIRILAGDDQRLFRWDVTEYTASKQTEICTPLFDKIFTTIIEKNNNKEEEEEVANALNLLSLCITDNPSFRSKLSEDTNEDESIIFKSIVGMLKSDKSIIVEAAAHLIWIAVFANKDNYNNFIQNGVIDGLKYVIMNNVLQPIAIAWSAAALQNLMASYCEGEQRCWWDWNENNLNSNDIELQLDDSGPIFIDGTSARIEVLQSPELIERLVSWTCIGPVRGGMSIDNPYPGENAIQSSKHEQSQNIIPWAAAGAIKNLALEPLAKSILYKFNTSACLCRLALSEDWLEYEKAIGALHHLHRTDPCWFDWSSSYKHDADAALCVDRVFIDEEGYTCYDYNEDTTDEECKATDRNNSSVQAITACCSCDGGDRYDALSTPITTEEL